MRVCLLVSELFAWGKYSGYGSSSRRLGCALAERGVDVCAIVPLRPGQKRHETLDGIKVVGHPGWRVLDPGVYREVDADIYHSQEASLATVAAVRAMPGRRHLVTCLDPWSRRDWQIELRHDLAESPLRPFMYPLLWAYYGTAVVGHAVRRADAVYSQSRYLSQKMQRLYRLAEPLRILPSPYAAPTPTAPKASQPTVCYLARWDPRKRPELFFELARKFPGVRFVALGKAHNVRRDERLRREYGTIPNLEMAGFIHPFEDGLLDRILDESWIVVNTGAREGLPISYIESAAHRCAILSAIDADGFASRGGYHVRPARAAHLPPELGGLHATLEDYAAGLEWLLERDRWKEKAMAGFEYYRAVHSMGPALQAHLAAYEEALDGHGAYQHGMASAETEAADSVRISLG